MKVCGVIVEHCIKCGNWSTVVSHQYFLNYDHAKSGKIPTISCNHKTPTMIIYYLGTSIPTSYNTELQIYKVSCNYIHYLSCNLHTTKRLKLSENIGGHPYKN